MNDWNKPRLSSGQIIWPSQEHIVQNVVTGNTRIPAFKYFLDTLKFSFFFVYPLHLVYTTVL